MCFGPQVLRTPITFLRPSTPEGTPFIEPCRTPPPEEEGDSPTPVPRTPPPLTEDEQPLAPWTPEESSSSSTGEAGTPDSAFSSCRDSPIEVCTIHAKLQINGQISISSFEVSCTQDVP